MFPKYALTEADRDRLSKMLREWEDRAEQNIDQRMNEGEPAAPDLYLARTPAGGIPGMDSDIVDMGTGTGTGFTEYTGTGSEPGTGSFEYTFEYPGSAECELFDVNRSTGAIQRGPIKTQTIYNAGRGAVDGNAWVLVARDKAGIWWVLSTAHVETRTIAVGVLSEEMSTTNACVEMVVWENYIETSEVLTVCNWLLSGTETLAAGTKVIVGYDVNSELWFVIAASC